MRENRERKGKEKTKKNIIKGKERRNKGCVEKEEEKKEKKKKKNKVVQFFFTVFRRPEFDSLRIKVCLLDESYKQGTKYR